MIFVTVGMHPIGFERLIRKMDQIAGIIEEEVIMQIGGTSFQPQNARWFDFTTGQEIRDICKKARVVVTHPAMSILDALEQGTPVVIVPRLRKYNEVIDDHQLDFARELEKEGRVIAVYDVDELEEALVKPGIKLPQLAKEKRLVDTLKRYIATFEQNMESVNDR